MLPRSHVAPEALLISTPNFELCNSGINARLSSFNPIKSQGARKISRCDLSWFGALASVRAFDLYCLKPWRHTSTPSGVSNKRSPSFRFRVVSISYYFWGNTITTLDMGDLVNPTALDIIL